MQLTPDQVEGLGIALNEATLLGVEVDVDTNRAAATFSVLTLPVGGGPSPADPRVQFLFTNVGRVAASLRLGPWNDPQAAVQAFALDDLLQVVESFEGLPVYGWDFFDSTKSKFSDYQRRLSLDVTLQGGCTNTVELFQEQSERHLDLWLWFDDLEIRTPTGSPVSLEALIAGGRRWWDAFHQHDPRTQGVGMVPLSPPPSNEELKPTAPPSSLVE